MDYRKLSDLKLNDKNPRGIKTEDFNRLKKQIQKLGQYKPVLIKPDGTVLGGNMRLRAYKDLGVEDIWVSIVEPKNETEEMEYVLSDNDSAGYWEEQDLAELITQLPDIELETYKIDIGKFKSLDDLIKEYAPDEVIEDEVPELPEEPTSKLGEVYELGRHRLMCGDSTKIEDVERLMNGQKADMVFTDPPYGMAYGGGRAVGKQQFSNRTDGSSIKSFGEIVNDDLEGEELIKFLAGSTSLAKAYTKEGGSMYICGTWRTTEAYYASFINIGVSPKAVIVWNKGHIGLGYADYRPQHEFIYYFDGQFYGDKAESDLWEFSRGDVNEYRHPTQKPVELPARAIRNSSKQEDIILDLFGGSGSTLIACEQLERTCYMMELDPKYCDVIRKRYENYKDN